jgi:hypothetical protein
MIPSEKAKILVHTFYYKLPNNGYLDEGINSANSRYNEAIMCALVTVDEIIELLEDNGLTFTEYHDRTTIEYWLQVKQEINKLYDSRSTTENPIGNG